MLPKNYMSLPKKGFEIPLEKWLMKDLKYLLDKVSKPEVLESLNIKNKTLVDNWKNDFIHGKSDNSWKLWTLINFTKWAELNKYI